MECVRWNFCAIKPRSFLQRCNYRLCSASHAHSKLSLTLTCLNNIHRHNTHFHFSLCFRVHFFSSLPHRLQNFAKNWLPFEFDIVGWIGRCEELNLVERCHPIEPRPGTLQEILLKHTQEQFDILAATSNEANDTALEDLSANYDAIYIHPVSFHMCIELMG